MYIYEYIFNNKLYINMYIYEYIYEYIFKKDLYFICNTNIFYIRKYF